MILNVVVDENTIPVDVDDDIVSDAGEFFDKLDSDMSKGWQLARDWVDNPNQEQRCQVVADRLLTALETENRNMAVMMAAYLLNRVPGIKGVRVASNGEIQETEIIMDVSQF